MDKSENLKHKFSARDLSHLTVLGQLSKSGELLDLDKGRWAKFEEEEEIGFNQFKHFAKEESYNLLQGLFFLLKIWIPSLVEIEKEEIKNKLPLVVKKVPMRVQLACLKGNKMPPQINFMDSVAKSQMKRLGPKTLQGKIPTIPKTLYKKTLLPSFAKSKEIVFNLWIRWTGS